MIARTLFEVNQHDEPVEEKEEVASITPPLTEPPAIESHEPAEANTKPRRLPTLRKSMSPNNRTRLQRKWGQMRRTTANKHQHPHPVRALARRPTRRQRKTNNP